MLVLLLILRLLEEAELKLKEILRKVRQPRPQCGVGTAPNDVCMAFPRCRR